MLHLLIWCQTALFLVCSADIDQNENEEPSKSSIQKHIFNTEDTNQFTHRLLNNDEMKQRLDNYKMVKMKNYAPINLDINAIEPTADNIGHVIRNLKEFMLKHNDGDNADEKRSEKDNFTRSNSEMENLTKTLYNIIQNNMSRNKLNDNSKGDKSEQIKDDVNNIIHDNISHNNINKDTNTNELKENAIKKYMNKENLTNTEIKTKTHMEDNMSRNIYNNINEETYKNELEENAFQLNNINEDSPTINDSNAESDLEEDDAIKPTTDDVFNMGQYFPNINEYNEENNINNRYRGTDFDSYESEGTYDQLNERSNEFNYRRALLNVWQKQNELIEKMAIQFVEERNALRSEQDFENMLTEMTKKKKEQEAMVKKTSTTTIKTTRGVKKIPTVKTLIDETEVRKALKKNPFVQRILKMANRKREQYLKKVQRREG